MASVFRAFGSKVTIIEFMKECLPTMDQELARRLRKSMEKQGIVFHLGCGLQQVDGDKVTYQNVKKGTSETIEADCILVATGRQANVEGLGLENTSIEVGRRGIEVDDNMQTTVPHIYAIGDVNGRQMLAHAATFQGFHAINHILGKTDNIRLNIMPAAVFTHPEIASVGLTEDKCKEMGIACAVRKSLYRANGRAQASEATDGLLKLVCDDQGKLIGCHALGQEASWMVQEVATLMNFDATADRLAEIVHIHPTLSEILLNAASHIGILFSGWINKKYALSTITFACYFHNVFLERCCQLIKKAIVLYIESLHHCHIIISQLNSLFFTLSPLLLSSPHLLSG